MENFGDVLKLGESKTSNQASCFVPNSPNTYFLFNPN